MRMLSTKETDDFEHIPSAKALSLEELFELASKVGKLTTGSSFSGLNSAELKLHGCHGDYISVKSKNHMTLRENIAECIDRGRRIQSLYS